MRSRIAALVVTAFLSGSILFSSVAFSWTGPSAAPPNSNVNAPINVGSTDQTKNANLGVNGLAVFGNMLMASSTYLDFGSTAGVNGYGIRDNSGTLEFKNYLGSWSSIQSTVSGLVGTDEWTTSGSNIYNANAGNVGIGTTPTYKLHVAGTTRIAASTGATGLIVDGVSGQYGSSLTQVTTAGQSFGALISAGTNSSDVAFYVRSANGSTPFVYVRGDGNVGIGTTGSTHRLHVVAPATSGVYGIYGAAGVNDAVTYGVLGTSANGYYGALGRGDGYSFVGNGTLYNNGAAQATAFTYISDRTFKTNVKPLDQGLVTLMKLRPVSFTWKGTAPLSGQHDIGLIAQDVQRILPDLVHTDNKGTLSIDYVRLTPILIKAVQDQEAKIDALMAIVCEDHPEKTICRDR